MYKNFKSARYKRFIENVLKSYDNELYRSLFSFSFNAFISNVLEFQIYQCDERPIALSFIRCLSDLDLYDTSRFNFNTDMKNFLNIKFENIFPDSVRLLFNVSIEELFLNNLKISFSEVLKANASKDSQLFCFIDAENRVIRFQKEENVFYYFQRGNKPSGINDGFVLNIYESNSSILDDKASLLNSFYVKKYHKGSQNTKNCGSRSSAGETGQVKLSRPFIYSSSSKNRKTASIACHFLNLKEPLTYSILSALSLGPEVKFIINPYSKNGFYIATKNLNLQSKLFVVIDNLETENHKNRIQTAFCKKIKEFQVDYTEMSIGLIELDLFATIFMLKDLNTNNYGVLFDSQDEFDLQINKMSMHIRSHQFKIIDFAYPTPRSDTYYNEMYTFKDPNFVSQFIDSKEHKSSLKYDAKLSFTPDLLFLNSNRFELFQKAFEQLNSRIKNCKLEEHLSLIDNQEIESGDEIEKKLKTILALFSKNIKDILLRKRGMIEEEYMLKNPSSQQPRTNAELIGFTLSKEEASETLYANDEKNLPEAFEDLEKYCQGIMLNYKAFKQFLSKKIFPKSE